MLTELQIKSIRRRMRAHRRSKRRAAAGFFGRRTKRRAKKPKVQEEEVEEQVEAADEADVESEEMQPREKIVLPNGFKIEMPDPSSNPTAFAAVLKFISEAENRKNAEKAREREHKRRRALQIEMLYMRAYMEKLREKRTKMRVVNAWENASAPAAL